MNKPCPKCNNEMFHSGQIKTDKQYGDEFSFLDSVTDVLYVLSCKKCGYCETWIPDFLLNDWHREITLHKQDSTRSFADVEEDKINYEND